MNKIEVVKKIFDQNNLKIYNQNNFGQAFAPSNIALVKYWGKSNTALNIPNTDSLSIGLKTLGSDTKISIHSGEQDVVLVNDSVIENNTEFYLRVKNYLDLFRSYTLNGEQPFNYCYKLEIKINIPIASGLASSACGFAALVLAFDNLFNLNLAKQELSILARLGSGSASRSLWDGFVYWQKGQDLDGMDSFAYPIDVVMPDLCIGLLIVSTQKKSIGSTQAMLNTCNTSVLYNQAWQSQVEQDMKLMQQAIATQDLNLLGETAENNALAMHATMLAAKPAILYSNQDTIDAMHKIWELRQQGTEVYFTQDAGPNLKLIFNNKDRQKIQNIFANIQIIQPF